MKFSVNQVKLGILGGGQLGKMLLQSTSKLNIATYVLDPNENCPASDLCHHFTKGAFTNYEDVMNFGKDLDVVTIEIENVNVQALKDLRDAGKEVKPSPEIIEMIQDKGDQKLFYKKHNLPSSSFKLYNDAKEVKSAIESGDLSFPFIQKLRTEGYDGRGVLVVNDAGDLDALFDKPSVVEDKVNIDKELAIIVARNENGETSTFPLVEMEFNPQANLVEFLLSPARISDEVINKAEEIAQKIAGELSLNGILAIELFLDKEGNVWINECAPRPHNSGHHTIEGNITSQYEQHMRAILNLPLGETETIMPAVMVNLLGEDGFEGNAKYDGLEDILSIKGAFVHLYGKQMTKPFRKMGHITVVDKSLDEAIEKAKLVKKKIKVIT